MPEFEGKIRDRLRLGVNFFSVFRAVQQLSREPAFEPTNVRGMAEMVLEKIMGKSLPQARSDMPEVDWDKLLEFIMAILPIILQLLSLI